MKRFLLLLALTASLSGHAQEPRPHPNSRFIQSLLAGPLARDLDGQLVQAHLLRLAGEHDRARKLAASIELRLLQRIRGGQVDAEAATVLDAITRAPRDSELEQLREYVLRDSLVLVPVRQPVGGDLARLRQSFRSATNEPIAAFVAQFGSNMAHVAYVCEYRGQEGILDRSQAREVECMTTRPPADGAKLRAELADLSGFASRSWTRASSIAFVSGGYQVRSEKEGAFGTVAEGAKAQLRAVAASELAGTDGPALQDRPGAGAQRERNFFLAFLGGGFVLGLAIGAWRRAAGAAVVAATAFAAMLVVIVAALAVPGWMPKLGNLGSLEGQWALLLAPVHLVAMLAVGAVLWALAYLAIWLGTLVPRAARRVLR